MKNLIKNKEFFQGIAPFALLAFFLVSVKIFTILIYGNSTPYWDQWDSEAAFLFKPYLNGTLVFSDLFLPHNEHRILITRLFSLFLLKINGNIWSPFLEMIINSVIYVLVLVFLVYQLSKSFFSVQKIAFIIFSGLVLSIPFGWENSLTGFQSAFYFLILFSFASIWATTRSAPFKKLWWFGGVTGVLACLSLASGSITLLICVFISLFKYYGSYKKDRSYLFASAIFFVIGLSFIYLTPEIPFHQQLKAQNFGEFFSTFLKIGSWPIDNSIYGFLLIQSPAIIYIISIFKRKKLESSDIFILGLLLWVFGQYATLSYGRTSGALSSRYLDIFLIGLVINSSLLFKILENGEFKFKKIGISLFFIWFVFVGFNLLGAIPLVLKQVNRKAEESRLSEINVKSFLCTGDKFFLNNGHIPYPNPERLRMLLSDPGIATFLPENISPKNTKDPIGIDGAPFCNPGHLLRPYFASAWSPKDIAISIVGTGVIIKNELLGTDYFKSQIPNIQIIGSFINSENDTGEITVRLKRGDKILYRSGPRISGAFLLINRGGIGKYSTELPKSLEWAILDFSQPELPESFDATFIDAGTNWGEWFALGFSKP